MNRSPFFDLTNKTNAQFTPYCLADDSDKMIQFLIGTDWVFTCVVYKNNWNNYLLQLFTYINCSVFTRMKFKKTFVFLGQATFRLDYTPNFPTLQLGNSSGPLWLHSSVLPTAQRENSWIGGSMFALTHSPHTTTRNTSVDLWLHTHSPDCTTRKLVGQFMISCTLWLALLVRTVRRKFVGALWSPACTTRETRQALHVNAHFDGNSSALYRVIFRLCNPESRRAFDDSRLTRQTLRLEEIHRRFMMANIKWSSNHKTLLPFTILLGNSLGLWSCSWSTDFIRTRKVVGIWLLQFTLAVGLGKNLLLHSRYGPCFEPTLAPPTTWHVFPSCRGAFQVNPCSFNDTTRKLLHSWYSDCTIRTSLTCCYQNCKQKLVFSCEVFQAKLLISVTH